MSSLPPLSVLLVEDELVYQDTFREVFEAMPLTWQFNAVRDGASALEVLEQSQQALDLALIDMGLPDMLGTEVIAAVRQRFAHVPILVVTNFQSETTFLEAVRAGANGYLLKHETSLSLTHSIELVLNGQYPVSPAMARYLFKLAEAQSNAGAFTPADERAPDLSKISAREWELLQLMAQGHSYARCAELMGVALSTVQSHIRNIYRRLEVKNHRQAMNKILPSGAPRT